LKYIPFSSDLTNNKKNKKEYSNKNNKKNINHGNELNKTMAVKSFYFPPTFE